jgi:hypothetical protein
LGASWEGFVLETLALNAPEGLTFHFYRTSAGAEIDLLLAWPDGRLWAVEVKRSLSPKVERGFHVACADLRPERKFLVYPGTEAYPLGEGLEVIPLREMAERLHR